MEIINKKNPNKSSCQKGLTLIELTVVIVVLMILIGVSIFAVGGYNDWKLATDASQKLRMVYNAQRTYLAEHPTESVASLTDAKIIPYLSDKSTTLPTVEGLDGVNYSINVSVSPPVAVDGADAVYDPSGAPDDGLWDVGG